LPTPFRGLPLPNPFRRLFGEGAFNSAFVPLFAKKLEGEGKEAAPRLRARGAGRLGVRIPALTVIAEIAMPFLMYGLAPASAPPLRSSTFAVLLTRITMPYLLCMSLVALLSGVLNSVGKLSKARPSRSSSITMMAPLVALGLGLRNDPLAGIIQARACSPPACCSCGCSSTARAATASRSDSGGRV
jgi:putative peptidoglycan lipid II flippase